MFLQKTSKKILQNLQRKNKKYYILIISILIQGTTIMYSTVGPGPGTNLVVELVRQQDRHCANEVAQGC